MTRVKVLEKKFTLIVFCMILITTFSSVEGSLNDVKNNVSIFNEKNNYDLEITDFHGGIGFHFSIINNDIKVISNIKIKLNIIGGGLVLPGFKQFEIPSLEPNESHIFKIRLFGLGLGNIFRSIRNHQPDDFPIIFLNVTSPDIVTFEKKLAIMIIGPFVYVGGEFFNFEESSKGFTLFSPEMSRYTYLINNKGETVHYWKSNYIQGIGSYLLENGSLLRTSLGPEAVFFHAITNGIELFDWDGNRLWYFQYGNETHKLHHDIEPLPNGNILMTAFESKSKIDAINAGKNPNIPNDSWNGLWSDYIIEVKPNGSFDADIVWEWHVWDHLIQDYDPLKENFGNVADHPELIDINFFSDFMELNFMGTKIIDFNHINSIDYNEDLDQILLSVRHFDEIWVIDHSTTTEQASAHSCGRYGKGGDLLYRWGNPQTYRAGGIDDQKLFCQHDARWISSGYPGEEDILMFSNGNNRPGKKYSSVDEIFPPIDEYGNYNLTEGSSYEPDEPIWTYNCDFYAEFLGGTERLSNGNTLICDGSRGSFFEVTSEKEIVWRYDNLFPYPITTKTRLKIFPFWLLYYTTDVFKINRYSPDYPGLEELWKII
jgi:hypothetical protein